MGLNFDRNLWIHAFLTEIYEFSIPRVEKWRCSKIDSFKIIN